MNAVGRGNLLWTAALIHLHAFAQSVNDTTTTRTIDFRSSMAASYATSHNWQAQDFQNYALSGSVFVQDLGSSSTRRHQHQLLADLSYLKFIHSTWSKGTDRLLVSLLWSRSMKKWSHGYSALLSTQFLPHEELAADPTSVRMRVNRYGGLLLPGVLEFGYGATWFPWSTSSIQFSFASIKFTSSPIRGLEVAPEEHLVITRNAAVDMEYGASIVASINQPIGDRLQWINTSRIFCNAFDRDHVSFEFMNRVTIDLLKFVQLRLDTRLGYNPVMSYDLAFSQEVLLGFFYSRQVHKQASASSRTR